MFGKATEASNLSSRTLDSIIRKMADPKQKKYEFRAKLPSYVRVGAVAAIGVTILLVVV